MLWLLAFSRISHHDDSSMSSVTGGELGSVRGPGEFELRVANQTMM